MWRAPEASTRFLRAYYHYKRTRTGRGTSHSSSASLTARELARMPTYYIMDLTKGMAETAAEHMPSKEEIAACQWLTDEQLVRLPQQRVYTNRISGRPAMVSMPEQVNTSMSLRCFPAAPSMCPRVSYAGKSDWGVYQVADRLERDRRPRLVPQWRGAHLVEGAGHWVQQEQPETVSRLLLQFIGG